MATVLLVEDEDQVRVLAESVLASQGHKTLTASTEDQALALVERENVDLLFTDIVLHTDVQAGLTLATEAVKLRPDLKVLYTTGQAVTDGMKAMFVSNSACLPKPYTTDQLEATLATHFRIKPLGHTTPL